MSEFWDILTWKWSREERLVVSSILIAMVIVAGILTVFLLAVPQQEGTSAIGLLNQDQLAYPLPSEIHVNETLPLVISVENHEGELRYFVILAKRGNFSVSWSEGDPAPFPITERFDKVVTDSDTWLQPVQLSFNDTVTNCWLIWELWEIASTNGSLIFTQKWVYLPLNVTL